MAPDEMTIAAALEVPVLRRGLPRVVAGAEFLERPIRWVHAGEVPNMAAMLGGGELLLTTGMGIATAAEQAEFIAALASRGVAGLVIELGGTFASSLPVAMVRAAEEQRLPLIELHASVRFVAVTEAIHTEIVNRDYELLRRADALHRRFTASMLSGEGVPDVLLMLARTLGNPVFLEAHDGRLLAHAAPREGAADALVAAWTDRRRRPDLAGIEVPVESGRREEARLIALPSESEFDAFTRLALERAADIVALALLRTRHEEELLAVGHGRLLTALLEGRIDPSVAAARAADLGLSERGLAGFLPVVARVPASSSRPGGTVAAPWAGALRDLDRELATVGAPTLVGANPVEGTLLVLVGLREAGRRQAVADAAASALRRAAARAGREVVVVVAATCGWQDVGAELRDAVDVSALTAATEARWIDATSKPLDLLLWRLGEREDLHRYVATTIGPLLDHDAGSRRKLLPTLEQLCVQGGSRAATARALNLNRQSLYGRLRRLEGLLGVDLGDPEVLAALQVAVRARRHLRGAERGIERG